MKMLHKSINGHRIKAMVVFEMEIIDEEIRIREEIEKGIRDGYVD